MPATELPELLARYGYLAALLGTLLEGETLLVVAGLAAHRGYLSLPVVVLVGAAGGAAGDLGFFLLGRHYGSALLDRFPRFRPTAVRVDRMIDRHPLIAVLGVRFMYGLRTAGPAVIGATGMALARFVPVNCAGALLWSACWAGAGYLLGETAEWLLGRVAHFERELFAAVIAVGLLAALVALLRRRAAPRLDPPPGA